MEPTIGGWMRVLALEELPNGRPVRAAAGAVDILLYRDGERIFAVANRCTHQGAPLHKGIVAAIGSTPAVTCPLHGSMFQLADGRVVRGPAGAPLPAYEARVSEGTVEVRPR